MSYSKYKVNFPHISPQISFIPKILLISPKKDIYYYLEHYESTNYIFFMPSIIKNLIWNYNMIEKLKFDFINHPLKI